VSLQETCKNDVLVGYEVKDTIQVWEENLIQGLYFLYLRIISGYQVTVPWKRIVTNERNNSKYKVGYKSRRLERELLLIKL
jgi:hypothetical protein